ncbi:hypothetical protein GN316_19375 [Xylophilus sp. Kf1]|nr:hypothetical protein [Xylophilus sp. Kf1]
MDRKRAAQQERYVSCYGSNRMPDRKEKGKIIEGLLGPTVSVIRCRVLGKDLSVAGSAQN